MFLMHNTPSRSLISGLINVVSAKKAAKAVIVNMQRNETVVFIPAIYYYIQVRRIIYSSVQ